MSRRCENKLKKRNTADEAYFLKTISIAYFIICYYTIWWIVGVSIIHIIYVQTILISIRQSVILFCIVLVHVLLNYLKIFI